LLKTYTSCEGTIHGVEFVGHAGLTADYYQRANSRASAVIRPSEHTSPQMANTHTQNNDTPC